jgi:hypothetical protein
LEGDGEKERERESMFYFERGLGGLGLGKGEGCDDDGRESVCGEMVLIMLCDRTRKRFTYKMSKNK